MFLSSTIKMSSKAGPSKSVSTFDDNFEETLTKWYDECNSDESDIENEPDDDFVIESEHETQSEQSGNSEDETENYSEPTEQQNTQSNFGKNRFKWSANEVMPKRGRTLRHNIVLQLPGLKQASRALGTSARPIDVWHLIFSEDMVEHLVQWTNVKLQVYRQKFKRQSRSEIVDTDFTEIKAFLGLLVYTAVFKSNHESIRTMFATDGTGRDIFRCVMSKDRFAALLACLRFDNPEDRLERRKSDPTAPISHMIDTFIANCQNVYSVGQTVCIDEMLVSFRGRCSFKMYMPKKPAKYGLKLICLTDARNGYLFNSYIYAGKDSDGQGLSVDEKKLSKPSQSVVRLARPLFHTNRNITADNWFSSIDLARTLKENGLTYVGTVKKNKREIPLNFQPNRRRQVGDSVYGFTEDLTLLSYAGKKGRATILISSMHHNREDDPETQKPTIVSFYNLTKGGVDSVDEKCSKSSSSRRTRRWPMAIFFRILDIACCNSHILYQAYRENPSINDKAVFLKQLARQLVEPHMRRRETNPHIPRELKFCIRRVLGIEEKFVDPDPEGILEKRKICSICPSRKRRMTKFTCNACYKPICLQCAKKICVRCAEDL